MLLKSRKDNRTILIVLGIAALLIFLVVKANKASVNPMLNGKSAIVYRSVSCGCCANYIAYLRNAGVRVEERLEDDISVIKKRLGIPLSVTSCHTTQIENYVVEGHIPTEAIAKLLTDKPQIAGIGMRGMPSGSPGMPGAKSGSFDIKSFATAGDDVSTSLFMNL